jgi:hypothetical protein
MLKTTDVENACQNRPSEKKINWNKKSIFAINIIAHIFSIIVMFCFGTVYVMDFDFQIEIIIYFWLIFDPFLKQTSLFETARSVAIICLRLNSNQLKQILPKPS